VPTPFPISPDPLTLRRGHMRAQNSATDAKSSDRAEFPLQWLGEALIHQSIVYEGNPDRTNIRERFLYEHEDPKPQTSVLEGSSGGTAETQQPMAEHAQTQDPPSEAPRQTPVDEGVSMHEDAKIPAESTTEAPVTNGVKVEGHTAEADGKDADTEMGGTA
jgi:hypothetical protein